MLPKTIGKTLATRLLKLTDALAFARSTGLPRNVRLAQRRLDAFKNGLCPNDRKQMLAYLDRHDVADSASAILMDGR